MNTPLSDELLAAGGRLADPAAAGPGDFGNPRDEYAAARSAAALIDRSPLTKIELRGRDRTNFLHNLCTNDIKALAAGRGCEAFFTNAQGKVLAFVRVFAGTDSIWLDTVPGAADHLMKHLDRYLIMEKVELADRSADWAQLLVVGPRSSEVVAAIGLAAPSVTHEYQFIEATLAGGPCHIIAGGTLGLPSHELRVPADRAVTVWRQLRAAGEPAGLRLIGERAFDILRIEAGLPIYGIDMDESNLPQEIGRDRLAISFTKGCYIGQETIARIDAMGHVNRHLVGLKIAASEPPPRGSSISAAGKSIGQLTSSALSPTLNSVVALGYVRRGHERPGTELVIDAPGTQLPAVVHALPFHQ